MVYKPKNLKKEFYDDFKIISPSLILGLIIITIGLYIINWIFITNKLLEKVDKESPDSNRGAIIMMFLPFSWYFITEIFQNVIFQEENLVIDVFTLAGWILIGFLILKYLLDFCISFQRVTGSNSIFWFMLYFIGLIGLISIPLGSFYFIPLVFFLIITIPAMQAELNSFFKKYIIRFEKQIYYS